jgi:hypothetical protein
MRYLIYVIAIIATAIGGFELIEAFVALDWHLVAGYTWGGTVVILCQYTARWFE